MSAHSSSPLAAPAPAGCPAADWGCTAGSAPARPEPSSGPGLSPSRGRCSLASSSAPSATRGPANPMRSPVGCVCAAATANGLARPTREGRDHAWGQAGGCERSTMVPRNASTPLGKTRAAVMITLGIGPAWVKCLPRAHRQALFLHGCHTVSASRFGRAQGTALRRLYPSPRGALSRMWYPLCP
jgi:hypothetical protein